MNQNDKWEVFMEWREYLLNRLFFGHPCFGKVSPTKKTITLYLEKFFLEGKKREGREMKGDEEI